MVNGDINMISEERLYEELYKELLSVNTFNKEDVFKTFRLFVNNEQELSKLVDLGLLHYDYAMYIKLIKNSLFEDGLREILRVCDVAYKVNKNKLAEALNSEYVHISNGLASYTQSIYLQTPLNEINRFDLLVRQIITAIGSYLENSLKPYLSLFNKILAITKNKAVNQKKFGDILDSIMNTNCLWVAIYKDLFAGISVSQWRNIADHNTYKIISDDKIEVFYGPYDDRKNKVLTKDDLLVILKTLDITLYMNKIAFTLCSISYFELLNCDRDYLKKIKSKNTLYDDIKMQLVETSFAFGFKLLNMKSESGVWKINLESNNEIIDKSFMVKYLNILTALISEDFVLTFYKEEKVIYIATYRNNKLLVNHIL